MKPNWKAASLLIAVLLTRLAVVAVTYPGHEGVRYFEDAELAINLVEGKGYSIPWRIRNGLIESWILEGARITGTGHLPPRPSAMKPPVYPLLNAAVFAVFGLKNFLALFCLHAVLAALTAALLYLSLRRFSEGVAALSGLAVGFYPPFVYHSSTVPESTAVLLFWIALFFYCVSRLQVTASMSRLAAAGLVAGLMALTDPVTLTFTLPSLAYLAIVRQDRWGKRAKACLAGWGIFFLVLAPWVARNTLAFGELTLLKPHAGFSWLRAVKHSGISVSEAEVLSIASEAQQLSEPAEDRLLKELAFQKIREHPGQFLRSLPGNFQWFWWESEKYSLDKSTSYLLGRKLPYLALLLLSLPLVLVRLLQLLARPLDNLRENPFQNVSFFLIFAYTGVYTVFGGWNLRYHFPIQLALFPFAAQTLVWLADRWRGSEKISREAAKAPRTQRARRRQGQKAISKALSFLAFAILAPWRETLVSFTS